MLHSRLASLSAVVRRQLKRLLQRAALLTELRRDSVDDLLAAEIRSTNKPVKITLS